MKLAFIGHLPSMRHGMRILVLAVALVRSVAEFTLGALTASSIWADSGFVAIIAAHFDFRKHFEPDLRARRWKAIQKRTPAIDGYRCIALYCTPPNSDNSGRMI